MATDNHGLTPKQRAFACEYIETGNASEAYRRAGYNVKGMKPATLEREAHAVRHHPKVSPRINDLMAEHAQRHNISVDSLTAELEKARESAIARVRSAPPSPPSWARQSCMGC